MRVRQRRLSYSIRSASSRFSWSGANLNLSCSDSRERRKLIDPSHPLLNKSYQCELLGVPRSTPTTSPYRCVNRYCRSRPVSMLSNWRIPAEWSISWPEKKSRTAVIERETTCGAWVDGRSTNSNAPWFRETHKRNFTAW